LRMPDEGYEKREVGFAAAARGDGAVGGEGEALDEALGCPDGQRRLLVAKGEW